MYFIQTEKGKEDIFKVKHSSGNLDESLLEKPTSIQNYLICFTGRSGSTMLCDFLSKTNMLGQPNEFTNPRGPMPMYLRQYPATNIEEYFKILRRVFLSPNGIFGMKTSYPDFQPMIDAGLVSRCLKPVRFIYLTRQDIILQAISYSRARQSNYWHKRKRNDKKSTEYKSALKYDEKEIQKEINALIAQQMDWEKFFTYYSINPLRITYEDMLEDINSILNSIAGYLSVEISTDFSIADAETDKIGDDINKTWAKKFRSNYTL